MENYLGFIEFLSSRCSFCAGAILEMVGRRLDRKKEAERAKQQQPRKRVAVDIYCRNKHYFLALGIRNGSIACTIGILKRSSDRLSCIKVTGSPSSFAETTDRA